MKGKYKGKSNSQKEKEKNGGRRKKTEQNRLQAIKYMKNKKGQKSSAVLLQLCYYIKIIL